MRQPGQRTQLWRHWSRGRLLTSAFATTGSGISSNGLVEFAGASIDDIGVRTSGGL